MTSYSRPVSAELALRVAEGRRKLTGVMFDLKRPRKKWKRKGIKDNLAETLELTKS